MPYPHDATELAEFYAKNIISPIEYADYCLERCRSVPNACIAMLDERAGAEARSSAKRWREQRPLSPLDGVPLAWKDLFAIRGTATTAGSEAYRNASAAEDDCPLVTLAGRAGLTSLCKTNLTEFAFSNIGNNQAFGTPVNPRYKPAHAPGGSSSASAVLVAVEAVPLAMGSDTGGSVRIPASYNGVIGFHASSNRYPREGVFPFSPTLDSVGFFARSIRDCIALDALLASEASPLRTAALQDLHFFVETSVLESPFLEEEVRERILLFGRLLEQAGCQVTRGCCQSFQEAMRAIAEFGFLGAIECTYIHEELLNGDGAQKIDPRTCKRLQKGLKATAKDVIHLFQLRGKLQHAIQAELAGRILLLPSTPHVAPLLEEALRSEDNFFRILNRTNVFTTPGNFMDMPAFSLPIGNNSAGLPIGVQLCLPVEQDRALLAAALAIEPVFRQG